MTEARKLYPPEIIAANMTLIWLEELAVMHIDALRSMKDEIKAKVDVMHSRRPPQITEQMAEDIIRAVEIEVSRFVHDLTIAGLDISRLAEKRMKEAGATLI